MDVCPVDWLLSSLRELRIFKCLPSTIEFELSIFCTRFLYFAVTCSNHLCLISLLECWLYSYTETLRVPKLFIILSMFSQLVKPVGLTFPWVVSWLAISETKDIVYYDRQDRWVTPTTFLISLFVFTFLFIPLLCPRTGLDCDELVL